MDMLEACCNSRKLWEETLLCIQHAIVATDFDGRVLFSSPAVEKVLGLSPDELMSKDFSTVLTPEDRACLYPNLLYLARNDRVFEGELMLVRKNGQRFFAYVIIRPHFDPISQEAMAVISIQDIDNRKQLEKAIREIHYEDLIKIANGIAHELRNPLVGIGGFVTRLFKTTGDNPEREKYYDHITSNLKKIENLVKKVELFVKLPVPCFAQVSAIEAVLEALEPYRLQLGERGIDVTIDIGNEVMFVDRDLVMRACSILIENAMDALKAGGSIRFHGEADADHFTLYVTDTGSGISSDNLSSIFNPFFSTKPGGAGIDLAIVKRIARIHAGEVGVRSKEGESTTFYLVFPMERRRPVRTSLIDPESKSFP